MLGNKIIGEDVLHVTSIEKGVADAVDFGIYLGVLDGFRHIFDANHLTGLARHKVGNGASTGIKVVHHFVARESCKLPCYTIKMIGLFGIRLIETLRTDLEFQVFHCLENMVFAFEYQYLLVANRIVTFLIVEIH